jgi:NAD(P)-dependent dehydrogenase (short-subunit alcohol dehydrogenase family)
MRFDVRNTIALITGSNRGIGKAIVQSLLSHGAAKVYAAARDPGTVTEMVAESGGRVVPIKIDLTHPETITAAAAAANDVRLVINNAGVFRVANPLSTDAEVNLAFEMEVNVYGLIRMARAFAPVLAAQGGGAFVQLNSVASLKNFSDSSTYGASKAAAYSITQGLRDCLAKQGTLVVSVHPGPIATDMANAAGFGEIAEPPSRVAEAIVAGLAAGEFHVFPDSLAKQFWAAYEGFARSIVEADLGVNPNG